MDQAIGNTVGSSMNRILWKRNKWVHITDRDVGPVRAGGDKEEVDAWEAAWKPLNTQSPDFWRAPDNECCPDGILQ